jgi:GT2 family glycosyltransferase
MTTGCVDDRREAAAVAADELPFITVIVPVRNEEKFIGRTLDRLLAQNYDPARCEVLVADGESTDGTAAAVRRRTGRNPTVRLLPNPGRLSSAGRNVAVRAGRGDVFVLVDGHCDLDNPDYLLELARTLRRSGADCVGRPQPLDVRGATALQRAIAHARSSPLGHNPTSFIYSDAERFVPPQSVAVAYRRTVFDRVGLFDERFDACEDVEFNHRVDRAGLRCFFTPRLAVRYHPRSSLRGLFHQMSRYGRGRVRLFRKHPETFSVACCVPAAWVVGVLAGAALALLMTWAVGVFAAALALYAAAVVAVSLALAVRTRDLGILPWLPLVFPTIHAGAGCGVLRELCVPRRESVAAESSPQSEPVRKAA